MPAIFHPLQVDAQHVYKKYLNGSWLGAVEFADGNILLLGALATDAHVHLIENQLSGHGEAGEIEWFIAYGQENLVFAEYAQQLGNRFAPHGKTIKSNAPRVWCSWHSLYYEIDEPILHKVIKELGDMPFDVLQVDDGWQVDIGDWEANKKFPSGMMVLADKIKSTGRQAGLWLAPLIATKSSQLFREHNDWFLRDETGRLVSAGFNWGERLYALDTTHPAVTLWLSALMKQVRAWGFDYLKLDFLYAGVLKGKRHKDMPREASYRDAHLLYNPTIPRTRNAIRTTLHRLWLKPLVHIDPDVTYFESKENQLSHDERILLRDLAQICEFKATSDLPQWLTKGELEELRSFLDTKPTIKQAGRYIFQIDDRTVDFTSATALPKIPKGLTALWVRAWVGWETGILFYDCIRY